MVKTISNLTVLFEEPFWVGYLERVEVDKYEVYKITFGAEPKDYEVKDYLLKNWKQFRFSPSMEVEKFAEKRINPKRKQRDIKRMLQNTEIGTKAQQAIKLQQKQGKLERKVRSREQRELEKQRQFELHKEKRKQKHKGH